jgi:hypothetical protein
MWRCQLCRAENGLERFVFERSEFRTFPILRPAQLGIPQGQRLCVAFFCFRFLAKQEKEVAAGLPPACNHTTTTEIQTRPSHKKPKTKNQKQHAAITHIPCALQASMLEEAHGICAVAGSLSKIATMHRHACDYA